MKNKGSLISRFAASTALLAATVVVLSIAFYVFLFSPFFHGAILSTLDGFSSSLSERIWEEPQLARLVAGRHKVGMVLEFPDSSYAFDDTGKPVDILTQMNVGPRYTQITIHGSEGRTIYFFWDMVFFAREHLPLLVGLIALLLVMIGATYLFQLKQLRPLRWLRTGVDAVSDGDFSTRVPVVRNDEIGQVAKAFNQMTKRIEAMISDRERLLADVSHELRSPLARIKVALELIPESEKRDTIAKDVREMETLTTMLLERERARTLTEHPNTELVNLAAVTREVLQGFQGQSPDVHFDSPRDNVEIQADRALMRVLIQNLVDNAYKFSLSDSGPIEITLKSSAEGVELTVSDDGPGIPESEIDRVFKPFVKLDPARGHRSGFGLGLNLCQRIVDAHGGEIEIGRAGKRGTRVQVRFPAT